jgi:hypothetical protein
MNYPGGTGSHPHRASGQGDASLATRVFAAVDAIFPGDQPLVHAAARFHGNRSAQRAIHDAQDGLLMTWLSENTGAG